MKLTKFKKVIIATSIATISLGVVASAAVVYSNLRVHYNVNLVVNGAQYSGTSDATKPFLTESGRTYISIASLVESGIANAAYDASTSTVTVTSGTTNQSQITALSNQILALENQNAVLKAENEKLKGNKGTSTNTSTGVLLLKTLTKSSDRTSLEREIVKDLRSLRVSLTDFGSIRFDDAATVKINQTSNKVTVTMYDSSVYGLKGTDGSRAKAWNTAINGKYNDDIEEEIGTFIEEDVMSVVRDVLSEYTDFDIEVTIKGYKDSSSGSSEYELAYTKYTDSKDTIRTNIFEI